MSTLLRADLTCKLPLQRDLLLENQFNLCNMCEIALNCFRFFARKVSICLTVGESWNIMK